MYCFVGYHTVKPIDVSDKRRVCNDILAIHADENIQEAIDSIPEKMPNVRVLTIDGGGIFRNNFNPKLKVSMPKLEELQLEDVAFSEVTLDLEHTPRLSKLTMQNIPNDCKLKVSLPELKDFNMDHYCPADDETWIHVMLSKATKLETFDSYKLRVGPELHFASNDLKSIRLHRAELLCGLTLYAPRLLSLDLQACYDFYHRLVIKDSHPDFPNMEGRPSTFVVNTENACISPEIAQILRSHRRVVWDDSTDDDDMDMFGGTEAMFARMHSNF